MLRLFPINLVEANQLVADKHRHNGVLKSGCFFCIGLLDDARTWSPETDHFGGPNGEKVVGAVIVGSVAARLLYKPWACEVRRLVTDGTPNACSLLYGAAWRAAQALGYQGMITFTLTAEPGASLRASNWRLDEAHVPVRHWKSRAPEFAHLRWSERPETGNSPALPRFRWYIGRRIPSQSPIAYPDDPEECVTLRQQNGVETMDFKTALAKENPERSSCGTSVEIARLPSKQEDPVKLGGSASP